MDVFERVREVNEGARLTEDRISGARSRLMDGIDASRTRKRKRLARRPMILIAGAVVGVGAVTTAVVAINQPMTPPPRTEAAPVVTPDPRQPRPVIPKPEVTAGAVVAAPFPGTTPEAGQYLRIESAIEYLNYRTPEGAVSSWNSFQGAPIVSALVTRDRQRLFMPADRSDDWYSESGPFGERLEFFPGDQSAEERAVWDSLLPVRLDVQGYWTTGGLAGDALPMVGSTEYYAELPRDPQALLDSVRLRVSEWTATPAEADDALLELLTFDLLRNIAPADVRETYLAALRLSGLAQTDASTPGITTYEFRRELYNPRTETISVDQTTGWVKEHTVRYDRAEGAETDMAPDGLTDIRTTSTVTIVNSGP